MDLGNIDMVTIVGAGAALCSIASFVPQASKIIGAQGTKGLSAPMYMLTVAAFALWMAYGFIRGDWAIIVPNLICLLLAAFILAMIVLPKDKIRVVATRVEDIAGRNG